MDEIGSEICVIRQRPVKRSGFLGLGPVIRARWVAEVTGPWGSRMIGQSEPFDVQVDNFAAQYTANQQLQQLVDELQRYGWQPRGESEDGKTHVMIRPRGR